MFDKPLSRTNPKGQPDAGWMCQDCIKIKEPELYQNLKEDGDFKITNNGYNTHELQKQLKGKHIFISGNHDKNNGSNTPIKYCVVNTYGKTVLLIHRPEDAELIMAGGGIDLAFVGHVHEKWVVKDKMINVGVDVWNYYPVDAKQILKFYFRYVGVKP